VGPTRKLSALVVDDEPSLVRVIEGYLIKDGFDVRTAGDGETALALARDRNPTWWCSTLAYPAWTALRSAASSVRSAAATS